MSKSWRDAIGPKQNQVIYEYEYRKHEKEKNRDSLCPFLSHASRTRIRKRLDSA